MLPYLRKSVVNRVLSSFLHFVERGIFLSQPLFAAFWCRHGGKPARLPDSEKAGGSFVGSRRCFRYTTRLIPGGSHYSITIVEMEQGGSFESIRLPFMRRLTGFSAFVWFIMMTTVEPSGFEKATCSISLEYMVVAICLALG